MQVVTTIRGSSTCFPIIIIKLQTIAVNTFKLDTCGSRDNTKEKDVQFYWQIFKALLKLNFNF